MNRYEQLKRNHDRRQQRVNIHHDEEERRAPVPGGHNRRRRAVVTALAILVGIAVAAYLFRQRLGGGNADTGLARSAERYRHAVALVVLESAAGETVPMATAWALSENRFATCAHVVEGVVSAIADGARAYLAVNGRQDERLYVTRAGLHGRYGQAAGADTNDVGFAFDVGMLQTEGKAAVWFPLAPADELARLKPGYRVAALGYPMERLVKGGVDPKNPVAVMQSGIITAVSDFALADAGPAGNLLLRHNLGSTGGSSGSPLFNGRGQVVGILNAGNMTQSITGIDEEGRPVVTRAPSAAMVNFGQRADLIAGVTWYESRPHAPNAHTVAAEVSADLMMAEDDALTCMVPAGTNVSYRAPQVASDTLLGTQSGTRDVVKERFPDGAKKRVEIVGPSGEIVLIQIYHDNGQLAVASPRRAGRTHGEQLHYTRAGRLFRRQTYAGGRLDGISEDYNIVGGFVQQRRVYRAGELVDPEIIYDQHGAPWQGQVMFYYHNGEGNGISTKRSAACPVVNGRRHGKSTHWFESGVVKAVCEYRDGWLHGPYEKYYESGKSLARGGYLRDKLHGECEAYWEDGATVKERGTYREGTRVGVFTWYNADGGVRITKNYGGTGGAQ